MIKARIKPENPQANLKSYFETYSNFSWSEVEKEFSQREDGKINIATEAVDRWANDPAKHNIPALIFEKAGKIQSFSYLELKEKSCRWAGLLSVHGFNTGDRLLLFLPACPEIYFIMVACARLGVIFSTLYTTFNFEELHWRIRNAEPRGIVTHPDFLERLSPEAMESVKYVSCGDHLDRFQAQRDRSRSLAGSHAQGVRQMAPAGDTVVSALHVGFHRPSQRSGARASGHGRPSDDRKIRPGPE